jgi:membrane protease YdiL (CAAX protease family)
VILLALALGLGLFITAIVLICMKQLRFAGVPTSGFDPRMLESFAVYMTITCSAIAWGLLNLPGGRVASLVAMAGSVVFAYMWPRWRGMGKFERAEAFGIARGQGVFWEIGCGIVGYIALLPIGAAALVTTVTLTKQFNTDTAHPISEMITAPIWIFLLVAAMAVIYAPITEELFFRGAFFGFLRTRLFWPIAAIVVGFIFAAIHPQGWAAIPVLGAIGVNLAILRQWRGSLIAPITAHALNNGTLILMMALALR